MRLSHEQFRELAAKHGLAVTHQRQVVYEAVIASHGHHSPEDIYAAVRRRIPKISLATVYKALDALVDSQVAAKIASAEGPARYDCRHDSHYHIRCLETGEIRDLETPFDPTLLDKLDPKLVDMLNQQGFEVTDYRLEILGRFKNP